MKIFSSRIVMARWYRKIGRHRLAQMLNLPTVEIREIEKQRRHTFIQSPYYNKILETTIDDKLIEEIADLLGFPVEFFQQYHDLKSFHPIAWCSSDDRCLCGKDATQLCDAEVEVLEPAYADDFNDLIIGFKKVRGTCDMPMCKGCMKVVDGKEYCEIHQTEKSRIIKPPYLCMACSSRHNEGERCFLAGWRMKKHAKVRA